MWRFAPYTSFCKVQTMSKCILLRLRQFEHAFALDWKVLTREREDAILLVRLCILQPKVRLLASRPARAYAALYTAGPSLRSAQFWAFLLQLQLLSPAVFL